MKVFGKSGGSDNNKRGGLIKGLIGSFSNEAPRNNEASQQNEVFSQNKAPRHFEAFCRLALWGLVFSFGAAAVFCCFYSFFRANAEKRIQNPIETSENISWLYRNCYLLYRDLHNAGSEVPADYAELYLTLDDKYSWLQERSRNDVFNEFAQNEERKYVGNNGAGMLTLEEYTCVMDAMDRLENMFTELENNFSGLNTGYDYLLRDSSTGKEITNMSVADKNRSMSNNFFYLTFEFDAEGNVSIGNNICGQDTVLIRKYANEAARKGIFHNMEDMGLKLLERYGTFGTPKNCTVTFAVSNEMLTGRDNIYTAMNDYAAIVGERGENWRIYFLRSYFTFYYLYSGADKMLLAAMAAMLLAGLFAPVFGRTRPWVQVRLCALPLEVLSLVAILFMSMNGQVMNLIVNGLCGILAGGIREMLRISSSAAGFLAICVSILVIGVYFFAWWYVGVCARAVRELGIRDYIRQRSLIYRFFPYTKKKILGIYHSILHLDLTANAHKTIVKIVLVNAAILCVISLFWVGGVGLIIVYSVALYVILRKYISDLQEKYKVLLDATNEMAEGRLNISINEDLGVFEPFKPQVIKIQEGFQKAVEQEVKSQRMKAELITNVSHDLKTPLTAIITYISLLKEENVTDEQQKEYLATLERKSLRLKALIEDLFEVSKANSQNITLNLVDVDIMNLVKQVEFEMSDKLREANLDVRMNLTDEKIILPLDSQKTYRIFENLFGNVAKYAMPGTRVYVSGFCVDDKVFITIKNISALEITVDSAELMERFVRGDASRNTEGSGLGLAIAKSFAGLQGGELSLDVDGDLFKASVSWTLP